MEQPTQFRSSFGGFNREDVVRYLEFINNKHSAQVAQLTSELEYLRGKQVSSDVGRVADLEKQLKDAAAENDSLMQRVSELEQQLREAQNSGSTQAQPLLELEAYRRAERAERIARERARQVGLQTTDALKSASARVDHSAAQIAQIVSQVVEQLNLLQGAMDGGHQAFQDAYALMAKLGTEIE